MAWHSLLVILVSVSAKKDLRFHASVPGMELTCGMLWKTSSSSWGLGYLCRLLTGNLQ